MSIDQKNISLKQISDEEIIIEIKNGNIEAYSEIVRRYNQRLYRIAVSYGVTDDDAEEVIQLAYISAYEKLSQFRGEAKFSTWLIRILINECLMLKRQQKRIVKIEESDNVTFSGDNHQNPEENYMNIERKEMLEEAVKRLPEKYRTVFIFKEIEGMSIEEISDSLGISKVNVKVRLHRAKSMLKEDIKGILHFSSLFTFGNERCDNMTENVMDYIRNNKSEIN
ncbi:MAG TPA: RNA polymerase sigma factor, partial [Ignavibacteriaceae bacterium]